MIFLILFFPFFSLLAAPVGNPSIPALLEEGFFISDERWSNAQLGFSADFLLQKALRPASHRSNRKKSKLWGNSQVFEWVWSIRERFNLGAQLGAVLAEWSWMQKAQKFKGRSNRGFSWSGDAKLILLEVKDTSLALDAQGGGWDGMEGRIHVDGVSSRQKSQLKLRYWQVSLAVTQKFGLFSPYGGCAFNQSRLNVGPARFLSKRIAGPFFGCSVGNGSRILLNGEWRGWFEEGTTLSCQIRF